VNRYSLRAVIRVLVVIYALFFLIFFFYSIVTLPGGSLIKAFTWPYVWTNSFILFIDYLIPITASAVMIAYSLFFKMEEIYKTTGRAPPFYRLVSSNLVLFIVLTLIYTALVIGFHPGAHYRLDRLFSLTRQARIYLDLANSASEAGNHSSAVNYYNIYLAIDKKNLQVQGLRAKSRSQVLRPGQEEETSPVVGSTAVNQSLILEMSAPDLLEKARSYYAREDFFSAHYYATLASRLDETDLNSRSLAGRAWEKISGLDPTASDREAGKLFGKKREGYTAFIDGNYITAYYIFNDLLSEYPQDPDVKSYHARSREKVVGVSFFLDEAGVIVPLPGVEEILFINKSDIGTREIVFIGKIVETEGGVFFQNIEAIRFEPSGRIIYHLYAPYGKLIENHINMTGIDRQSQERKALPVYYSGYRDPELKALLPLNLDLAELSNLRQGLLKSARIRLDSLWLVRKEFSRYGYNEEQLGMEIIIRLLKPFSFLILCLFSISLGWAYRTRSLSRPPLPALLFIPFFPYIVALFTSFYLSAQRTLLGFILISLGFTPALIVLLIMQGILLITSLIVLAGQKG